MRVWLVLTLKIAAHLSLALSLSTLTFSADALSAPKRNAKKGGSSKGVREKHITREAVTRGKDQSKIDFESVDIGGARKAPMGTLINQNKADKNYDFVKVRLRWHPEMVQSASSLDNAN